MCRIWSDHFNPRRACDLIFGNPACLLCLYESQAQRLTLAVSEEGQRQGDSAVLVRSVQLLYRENLIEPQRDYPVEGRVAYVPTGSGRWLLAVLLASGWTPLKRLKQPPDAIANADHLRDVAAIVYSPSAQEEARILRKILRTKDMVDCLLAFSALGRFTLPMLGDDAGPVITDTAHLRQMLLFFTRNFILQRHRLLKRYYYCYELTDYGRSIQRFFRSLLAEAEGGLPDVD